MIHTITINEDNVPMGARVRVVGLDKLDAHYDKPYTYKLSYKWGKYLGNANVEYDDEIRHHFYGLQLEVIEKEVGDEG